MERSSDRIMDVLNHGLTELWITLALFLPTYVSLNKALYPLRIQFLYKMSRMKAEDYQISPNFMVLYIIL